jgi:endonuclease YncB( thermonuclease family)
MSGTKVSGMAQVFDFRDHLRKRQRKRRLTLSARDIAIGLSGMAATATAVIFWPSAASGDALPTEKGVTQASLSTGNVPARTFGKCHSGGGLNCVVDGDTFWIDGEKVRIADIDTPETHPARCAEEARLGNAATDRLQVLLNAGAFELQPINRDTDRYGRKLRIVVRNGQSLGGVLVSEGLARNYEGGRRDGWCA